jgi:hypothetical protein
MDGALKYLHQIPNNHIQKFLDGQKKIIVIGILQRNYLINGQKYFRKKIDNRYLLK